MFDPVSMEVKSHYVVCRLEHSRSGNVTISKIKCFKLKLYVKINLYRFLRPIMKHVPVIYIIHSRPVTPDGIHRHKCVAFLNEAKSTFLVLSPCRITTGTILYIFGMMRSPRIEPGTSRTRHGRSTN